MKKICLIGFQLLIKKNDHKASCPAKQYSQKPSGFASHSGNFKRILFQKSNIIPGSVKQKQNTTDNNAKLNDRNSSLNEGKMFNIFLGLMTASRGMNGILHSSH